MVALNTSLKKASTPVLLVGGNGRRCGTPSSPHEGPCIRMFAQGNDAQVLFLPSYSNHVILALPKGWSLEIDNTVYTDGSRFAPPPRAQACLHSGTTLVTKNVLTTVQSRNVPTLHIETHRFALKELHAKHKPTTTADMVLAAANGDVVYQKKLHKFSGRGNTSWVCDEKKQYVITLDEPFGLLGMRPGTKWALLGCEADTSLLYSNLFLSLARQVRMEYSVATGYVDLYINGEYRGLYLLAESVDVGNGRVEIYDLEAATQAVNAASLASYPVCEDKNTRSWKIPHNPVDISGGYLLELELDFRAEGYSSVVHTPQGQSILVKSPHHASREQAANIYNYTASLEAAIYSPDGRNPQGRHYTELIDLQSWAMYYLIEEISAEIDIGISSMFFYLPKGGSAFHAGPVWDFDKSFCYDQPDLGLLQGLVANKEDRRSLGPNRWLPKLFDQRQFQQEVRRLYAEVFVPLLDEWSSNRLAQTAANISAAYRMNGLRWNQPADISAALERVRKQLEMRRDRLKFSLLGGQQYHTITITPFEKYTCKTYLDIPQGQSLWTFLSMAPGVAERYIWTLAENGEKLDLSEPVSKDIQVRITER